MQGSEKTKNTLQWLSYIQPLGQEIIGLTLNVDKIPANLAKNMGIDKELYKDSIEIDASKEQLKQMAQEAMAQGASPQDLMGGGGGQPSPMPL